MPFLAEKPPVIGETVALAVEIVDPFRRTITITSVVINILDDTGAHIRENVAGTFSGQVAQYIETFSAANGYVADSVYQVQFIVNFTIGGNNLSRRYEDCLHVKPTIHV